MFERVFQWQRRAEEAILATSVLTICAVNVANVILRNLSESSVDFAEELGKFLMIAITFVGASYAAGRARHIRMSALYDLMSPRGQRFTRACTSITTVIVLLILSVYALDYVSIVRELGTRSPVLGVPLYLVYLLAPLGLLSTALQFLLKFVRAVRGAPPPESEDQSPEEVTLL